MTSRMESGVPGDNSAEPIKDPKGTDGSQDYSCAETRAYLEASLNHECIADLTERLAQHVATYSHYPRSADAEAYLRGILRSRCAGQAPPGLHARVLERLSALCTTTVNVTTTSTMTQTQASTSGRVVHVMEF